MPSDVEITAMETFLDVMHPFIQITESVGGEKWVTLSVVRPLLYKLINKHLVDTLSDSCLKKTMKRAILNDLETRYTDLFAAELLDKACFLDPRFRMLSFLLEANRKKIITDTDKAENLGESSDQEPPEKRQRKDGCLMTLLKDICEATTEKDPKKAANKEFEKYLCIDSCSEQKPLNWWKNYEAQFPIN